MMDGSDKAVARPLTWRRRFRRYVTYVAIPKRTLNNEPELKAWLAEVEQLLSEKLKTGPVAL